MILICRLLHMLILSFAFDPYRKIKDQNSTKNTGPEGQAMGITTDQVCELKLICGVSAFRSLDN